MKQELPYSTASLLLTVIAIVQLVGGITLCVFSLVSDATGITYMKIDLNGWLAVSFFVAATINFAFLKVFAEILENLIAIRKNQERQ